MNSLGHPGPALQVARQKIDDQIRDAEARRTARDVRRQARSAATRSTRPRRRIRLRLRARA